MPVNIHSFTANPCDTRAVGKKNAKQGGASFDAVRVSLFSIRRPIERVLISGLVAADLVNSRNGVFQNLDHDEILTTLEPGYSAQFVAELNSTVIETRSCTFEITASVDANNTSEKAADETDKHAIWTQSMVITLSSSNGEIAFKPSALRFGHSFTGRVDELPLCVRSSHSSKVTIQSISSSDTRFYGRLDTQSIAPNSRTCVGFAVFDPSRKKILRWDEYLRQKK